MSKLIVLQKDVDAMDNKSKKKLILIIIIIVVAVLAAMGIRRLLFGFAVKNPTIYGYLSIGFVLFILVVVVMAKAAANKSDNIGSDGMSNEMRKYMILLGDKTPEDPGVYEARKCPNCGAPIDPLTPFYCKFCRTRFTDTSKKEKDHPISPEEYNPTRYYDENFTGYNIHSEKDQDPHSRNRGTGYGNGGFNNNSGYGNGGFNNNSGYGNSGYNNNSGYGNGGYNNNSGYGNGGFNNNSGYGNSGFSDSHGEGTGIGSRNMSGSGFLGGYSDGGDDGSFH